LKDLAAKVGLRFGSDSDDLVTSAPPPYLDLFTAQCALYAPNISWAYVNPAPGRYDFSPIQADLDFMEAHGLLLTGGHFLWHEQTPKWFRKITDRAEAEKAARGHIESMLARFKGRAWSWNVVNEALGPHGKDDLRPSPLINALGPDFIANAFGWARAAAGDDPVMLVYNDYGFEYENRNVVPKRKALLRLLDSFVEQKVPVDAIGLQSHLNTSGLLDPAKYGAFLKEIASRGFKIIISELDVLDKEAPADLAQRDQLIADTYRKFLEVALAEPAVKGLVAWGLSDRYSWYNDTDPSTRKNFGRPDQLPSRALMFDADFKPKPAFDVVVKALQNAPAR
jgi:endo-1,4-beta-xylanase